MNKINWLVAAVFGVVVLLAFLVGASLLGGAWGMMGPGMMGSWGFGPFAWIGMFVMSLVVVGFIVLTALGLVWLARVRVGGTNPR
ncbi:MAG: hypothetical protein AAB571_09315 [Chloroflexota bacterium]